MFGLHRRQQAAEGPRAPHRRHLGENALLVLVPVVLSLPFVAEPLARDQGYFAYGGWRMLQGEWPYRDFWANTFPGVFWWYWLMETVAVVPRPVWNGLVIGFTSLILAGLGKSRNVRGGLAYGIACPLLHRFWDMGQSEHLLNLLMAASLRTSRPVLSGVLYGAALLTKPVALLFAPLFTGGHWGYRTLGVFIPLAGWTAAYALVAALPRVLDDLVVFNIGYGSSRWSAELAGRVWRATLSWAAPLWPAVVLAVASLRRGVDRMGAWLVLSLLVVALQGKLFSYHWILPLAPLMSLAGRGWSDVRGMRWCVRGLVLAIALGPCLAMPEVLADTWYPAVHEAWRGVRHTVGLTSREEYLSGFGSKPRGDVAALEQDRVASELMRRGYRTVLVWGFEPGLNYLARIPCPMRYVVDFPLTFVPGSDRARGERDARRSDFLDEFGLRRPQCVVVVHDDSNPVETEDSYRQMQGFPGFVECLVADYSGPERIGSYSLWVRR